MEDNKRKFNLRSFTSFTLVISTLIMSLSGFILYIAPPNRIADWGTWRLLLFTKYAWVSLHTIFSYLFFILIIIHLFFINWKTFLAYFQSKLKSGINRKWELGTSLVLSSVIFIGVLLHWSPFEPTIAFGDRIKEGWAEKIQTPPVTHMETYTIEQLSAVLDSVPPEELLRTLIENRIKVSKTNESLKDIAIKNDKTPFAVYNILATKYQGKKSEGGDVSKPVGK